MRRLLASGKVAQVARDLRECVLRETSAGWDHPYRRHVVAAFSCGAIFSVIAISVLTDVAHSEPKIEKLSALEASRAAQGVVMDRAAPVHRRPWVASAERLTATAHVEPALGQFRALEPSGSVLAVFKSLAAPAQGRAMPEFGGLAMPTAMSSTSTASTREEVATVGTFSSVQSVVKSLQVSALEVLVAEDAPIEPIDLSALPISIDRPSPASILPLAEFILPVLFELPSSPLPLRRSRAVVAMTLISDVSTMDLMMPIAEPDLDIASHESVWAQVGKQFSIDPLLLYSIALVESKSLHPNGQVAPTPWLFRVSDRLVTGDRHHVQMQMAMAGQLDSAVQDVGIMQVYYPMHRNAARDPLTLLDPRTNISVAAKILKDGMRQTRDPVMGVGYYHSHTPSLALNYGTAVMIVYQRLKGVYRRGQYAPVVAHAVTRPPLRLAAGFSERPARIISARARVLAGQCLFL